tara:strand:+ start:1983 stop:2426 length:444 start_codon:yes stop_codon:yes gene_type:complete
MSNIPCGYEEVSEENIRATIAQLEAKLLEYVSCAARQDMVGRCEEATKYNRLAENIEFQIHTIQGLCPTPDYTFVDTTAELKCGGSGIGFWAIGGSRAGGSRRGCGNNKVSGRVPTPNPPPYGEFQYCSFRTSSFTEVTGGTPPTCS